ncbi:DUF2254 domain-containing protein [Erythrobacter sp. LQ02-29]|uniref:DUF2254 family protein n=1 Tax=Erythrobacter sp. LQ02-29 TaxID=2920384 RepID=UPI001F4D59CE|nr:DUF2254 family protein [Erythrobacter sp. LQ02-29]MCP9222225.1 DUF2254 domain-containing protein [Erythrobacter sp. LQ02-29]
MATTRPIRGLRDWLIHRLTANYWSLALCAVLSAPVVFAVTLLLDRHGTTDWLLDHDLSPVASADTAKDVAGVIAAVDAAFITLYFSISLLVLTLAASSLGVRLVDRWLSRPLVRVSIAGLSFSLVYTVLNQLAIDAETQLADVPLLTLMGSVVLLLVNIAMLAVALNDLGRTIYVDKAIAALAQDAPAARIPIVSRPPFTGRFAEEIRAERGGYIEGIDLEHLSRKLGGAGGVVRFEVAPGQFVLQGQPIVSLEHGGMDEALLRRSIPIAPFRNDGQGAVFQIRLLVEIGARALSPAVNDFYTALACADRMSEVILSHANNWVEPGEVAAYAREPRFELPGQDFVGLFDDPLNAFRQAAAAYPSVSIRLIENFGNVRARLAELEAPHGLAAHLARLAREIAEHARSRAESEVDRKAIDDALRQAEMCGEKV